MKLSRLFLKVSATAPVMALACALLMAMFPFATDAQVKTAITSSGLNTQVSEPRVILPGEINAGKTIHEITGGTRPNNGTNLFHSFGEFSIETNHIANFLNETLLPTTNIIGRINGGNVSNIFGTIQTTDFGAANLYLVNPSGFLFGPTASLNVGGSFAASTADYLRMTDGAKFYVDPLQPATLSIAPVAAFGFTNPRPVAISLQGAQLSVVTNQTLSVIGGDVSLMASASGVGAGLSAPNGQINVASVSSAGEVFANTALGQPTEPMLSGFTAFGNISILQGASIDTSGGTAGPIFVRGGQLVMDASSIKAIATIEPGGVIDAANMPATIAITADTVALSNGAHITADTHSARPAGDITFSVGTLTTQAGVKRIQLNPDDTGTITGVLIASDSRGLEAGAGSAGKITIQGVGGPGTAATSVTLKDTAFSTRVFGGTAATSPATITVTADSVLLTNEVLPDEEGAGAATIVTTSLGAAPAGNIALNWG